MTAASGIRTARAEQHRVETWAKVSGRTAGSGALVSREILGERSGSCNDGTGKRDHREPGGTTHATGTARGRWSRAAAAGSAGRSPSGSPARGRTSSSTISTSRARREQTLAEVEAAGRRGVLIQADLSRTDEARRLIDRGGPAARAARHPGQQRRDREARPVRRGHGGGLRQGPGRQPQGDLLHHPGVRAAPARREAAGQDHQHQLGARGAAVPRLLDLLRQQGRHPAPDPRPGRRAGRPRHHGQRHRPGRDRHRDQPALLDDKPRVERLLKQIPLGRMGKPEDVAASPPSSPRPTPTM